MAYSFEWDFEKEVKNIKKNGFTFTQGTFVFADPKVIFLEDSKHSSEEDRFYAVGRIDTGEILTVRYTERDGVIRIFGVAQWRKWRKYYEENTRS